MIWMIFWISSQLKTNLWGLNSKVKVKSPWIMENMCLLNLKQDNKEIYKQANYRNNKRKIIVRSMILVIYKVLSQPRCQIQTLNID